MSETIPIKPKAVKIMFPPVTHDGQTYDTLALHEPNCDQIMKIDGLAGMHGMISLAAMVSGVPDEVIRKAPISVAREAQRFLLDFIEGTAGDARVEPLT